MPDLERDLRAARPDWPEPSAAATDRAHTALGLDPPPRSPRGWLGRAARARGARLLVPAALLLTCGAGVAATLISGGQGSTAVAGRSASLDFGAPESVGAPADGLDGVPSGAVDGRGTASVAWGRAGRIVVSTRGDDGTWSPAERISDAATRSSYPRAAADRAGALTVVWRARTAGDRVVERFTLPDGTAGGELSTVVRRRWTVVARTRDAAGRWGPVEEVSPPVAGVRDLESPGLLVAASGATTVTWDAGGALWSRHRPAGGGWAPARAVGPTRGEVVDPRLTGAPGGTALAVWSNRIGLAGNPGRRYEVRAAIMGANGAWGEPQVLNTPLRNPPYAAGAVDDRGDAVVAWTGERSGTGRPGDMLAAVRQGGTWSEEEAVGLTSGPLGGSPPGGSAGNGRPVVVGGARARARVRVTPGTWRPVPLESSPSRVFGVATASDAGGGLLVAGLGIGDTGISVARIDEGRATDAVVVRPALAYVSLAAGADGTTLLTGLTGGYPPAVRAIVADGDR